MCWYILLVLGMWLVVSLLTHRFLARSRKNTLIKDNKKRLSNILFVIAHPDDECMFFGPAILSVTQPTSDFSSSRKKAKNVFLLCLSDGGAEGLGKIRQEELLKSCSILGLPDTNVFIHNGPHVFKDDPNIIWDASLLAETLQFYIHKYKIENVVTFDEAGVSGHLNHKALYFGVSQLKRENKKQGRIAVRVLVLDSINILRKYSAFIDAIFVRSGIICAADWRRRKTIQRAMAAHASQYVWFRRLYVTFSRYLFINTFLPLEHVS